VAASHGREKFLIPWWRIATLALLTVALGFAVANGRTVEMIIIGVLVVPTLFFVGVWAFYVGRHERIRR